MLATVISLGGTACDSTPETPANAVMDYLTAQQLGKPSASQRLCQSLRAQLDAGVGPDIGGYRPIVDDAGNVFGARKTENSGNVATVLLEVQFQPSPEFDNLELWNARMAKEGDKWKVCGFEPA